MESAYNILELFSGIGGMHYGFNYSGLPGKVMLAVDINNVANSVYNHNESSVQILNRNIQSLQSFENMGVNMILMSPPCQPHTRVGQQRDVEDSRSDALNHICEILPKMSSINYILMENVKGFEESKARAFFLESLRNAGFYWREFILSPTILGVPNTRNRYYCVARKTNDFSFSGEQIWNHMPSLHIEQMQTPPQQLSKILENEESIPAETYLKENVLDKRVWLLDIVTADDKNSMCFTKAYTHYSEGTGSVFTALGREEVKELFEKIYKLESQITNAEIKEELYMQRMEFLKRLQLRYFTPREVARLMSFPESFSFPSQTTNRQKYRLLGNSVNVKVVGELIKLLCGT